LTVYECDLLPCNGEILCCSVASSRMMITGGANSLVSVWRLKQKPNRLELMQHLYGHDDAITCLASSANYGLLVSGSRDRTCIVWDLNRLTFVRQLSFNEITTNNTTNSVLEIGLRLLLADENNSEGNEKSADPKLNTVLSEQEDLEESGQCMQTLAISRSTRPCCNKHPAPISAVCINELTGDLVTCCGSQVFLWTINGELLACGDLHNCEHAIKPRITVEGAVSSTVPAEPISSSNSSAPNATPIQILCACFSLYNEWELCNVIALGCSDGVVRLLSVKFVQTNESSGEESLKENDRNGKWIRKLILQAEVKPNVKDICAISAVNISKDCRTMYAGDLRGRVFSFVVNPNQMHN
jgi:hypothetical protein